MSNFFLIAHLEHQSIFIPNFIIALLGAACPQTPRGRWERKLPILRLKKSKSVAGLSVGIVQPPLIWSDLCLIKSSNKRCSREFISNFDFLLFDVFSMTFSTARVLTVNYFLIHLSSKSRF